MKLKHWFTLQVIMSTVHGLGMMLLPVTFLGFYGLTNITEATVLTARAYGSGLFTYAVVAFFARDSQPSTAREAIVKGFCITHVIGGIVMINSAMSGLMSSMAWLGVFFYFLMAAGYAYFWFIKKEEQVF